MPNIVCHRPEASDVNLDFLISRIVRRSTFNMRNAHAHPYYELYYLRSGRCKIFINHSIYYIKAGDIIMLTKGDLHQTTYRSYPVNERIMINFSERFLQPLYQECAGFSMEHEFLEKPISIPVGRRNYLEDLLGRIEYESRQEDDFSKLLLRNHFYELLILISRYKNFESPKVEDIDSTEGMIQDAAKYICTNFKENITLEAAAQIANMSPTYFSKKFKKTTGFGFKEYLTNIRMKEASRMLLTSKESITQIGIQCGFNDGNYFGDVFKKVKGVSPNQYRKNLDII